MCWVLPFPLQLLTGGTFFSLDWNAEKIHFLRAETQGGRRAAGPSGHFQIMLAFRTFYQHAFPSRIGLNLAQAPGAQEFDIKGNNAFGKNRHLTSRIHGGFNQRRDGNNVLAFRAFRYRGFGIGRSRQFLPTNNTKKVDFRHDATVKKSISKTSKKSLT
jgi:hypothetical protein